MSDAVNRPVFNRLLVILSHPLSDLVKKGEITTRYYNPGNLFEEVHILLTVNDTIDPECLQKTVGTARLVLHQYPTGKKIFLKTLGWQFFLLSLWANEAVELVRKIKPSMVRCHGCHLNAVLAFFFKQKLGLPYVVSLHINPDEDQRKRCKQLRGRLELRALKKIEKKCLNEADMVLPVYQPIVPFLNKLGVNKVKVCYNALNPEYLIEKKSYELGKPVKLISVGRQINEKNPLNIIEAIKGMEGVELTLVGNGALHEKLKSEVKQAKLEKKVFFLPEVPNDKLCEMLHEFDIFVVHTEYWEISKSVLEALLVGLPVIMNRRHGEPVPELKEDFIHFVENTKDSYAAAIQKCIEENEYRMELGQRCKKVSREKWSPESTECEFVQVYKQILKK